MAKRQNRNQQAADSGPAASFKRLTPTMMADILRMSAANETQERIAAAVGVSQSAVSRFLSKVGNPADVVQKVMRADSLNAAMDWRRARREAAKRGDHRPSREWIEEAFPELRPQQTGGGGGGVTVVIGMPGQPVQLPDLSAIVPTITVSPVRPALPAGDGDTAA